MNLDPLSSRKHLSRLVAILLLLLAVSAMIGLFVWPTQWLHKRYDNFQDDYLDKLQRYSRIAALRPAIEEATAEVLRRDSGKYYLRADSPNVAAADLQNLATRIVAQHGGRISSSQIQAAGEEDKQPGAKKVAVHVQFIASTIPLQLILHTLETHIPYLFIEKAVIASMQGRAYRPQPGVQPEADVHLTVSAYVLPNGAKP